MVSVVTETSVSPAVVSEEQHPPQADSYAVATLNRFLILQDKATEPAALETISSAVAPEVHHVSHLLTLSRPTVFWTMTHQLTLRLRENQFLTHLPHSCSNHRPRLLFCTRSLHRWSPRALNPADISASDPADSECSIGVFTSPTSTTRAPGCSCAAIVPYVPEFSCSDQSLVPFAAAVHLPASPLLFLPTGSPYFSLGLSHRLLHWMRTSFYALSLAPSFQEGGSDHYFSDGDGVFSPPALRRWCFLSTCATTDSVKLY